MTVTYPFTEAEARAAHDEWGCNCGPTALAFALGLKPDDVRPHIPDFDARRYTSPTMMAAALDSLNVRREIVRKPHGGRNRGYGISVMFAGPVSLVRIQWTGPWTANGASGKWAARQTHWIVCWKEERCQFPRRVFDVNGGIQTFEHWEEKIVPAIVATVQRADGGWFPANVWRLPEGP